MPTVQLPQIRLYYAEHGTGAPLLLIHGTSSDADIWGPATQALAELGRVIVYDTRDLDAWLAARRARSTSELTAA